MNIRETKIFDYAKDIVAPFRLRLLSNIDRKRFLKNSFQLTHKRTLDNLRGEITFEAHAIEKGLSHIELRPFFGKKRIERLIMLLAQYQTSAFDVDDERFLMGVSVLKKYISVHEALGYSVPELREAITDFEQYPNVIAGSVSLFKSNVIANTNVSFDKLAEYRHSVRDFGFDRLDMQKIYSALTVSERTPSVCNRQPWKNYLITDPAKMKRVLSIQGGIGGMAHNVQAVSVITTDDSYFGSITEHNQGYIDGGLYAMTFIYALTQQGLANCALNTDFNISTSRAMRQECGISENENLILVIAIGTYPDEFKAPVSSRDDYHKYTTFIK